MDDTVRFQRARPVLKWAGGKTSLLPDLVRHLPVAFDAYHEPFFGGGALFFQLAALGKVSTAFLSDINPSLVDLYVALRDHLDEVIAALRQHRHEQGYYYSVRSLNPSELSLPQRAARLIYLNKTCYNGLHRENRNGQFNVPFGRYKNPTICDEPNLRAVSCVLQGLDISRRGFPSVLDVVHKGDLVYFDPPYHPVSSTASFTSYDRNGFAEREQVELRDVFVELSCRGVSAMLSNSDTPLIRELYADFPISRVYAPRLVNSKAASRGKVPEVIVCNYQPAQPLQCALFGDDVAAPNGTADRVGTDPS